MPSSLNPFLNEALEHQLCGEAPVHEVHRDEENAHGGGNHHGLFPFDLNIPHDEEQENLNDYGVYADVNVAFDEEELSDSDDNEEVHQNANQATRRKDLTRRQNQDIYEALLQMSNNGTQKKDTTRLVANQFNVSQRTVQRVWKRAKNCRRRGEPVDVGSRKPKNCGKKKMVFDMSVVATIPFHERSTIRKLAKKLEISKSVLHRFFKSGLLRRHSNSLKPSLKEENRKERLRWCISMLDQSTLSTAPKFIEMDNIIHINEKWFNATSKNKNFYMLPGEEDPHRTVQNKNSIDKLMFLGAIGKPKKDEAGNIIFNGKIGIWAFARKEPAQRRSRNRERGTLVTKPIIVDRDTMRSFLIAKVLPAIKARWPRSEAHKTIWIQQDNARTHVPHDDRDFAIAAAQTGLDIRLMNQPPNSPDMNCLDLGFFASLQSLTSETVPRNLDDLIENVTKKFEEYDPTLLNRVYLTLQGCLLEVMKANRGNRYKIPHMNKERLEALGILPNRLECDRQLYETVIQSLATGDGSAS